MSSTKPSHAFDLPPGIPALVLLVVAVPLTVMIIGLRIGNGQAADDRPVLVLLCSTGVVAALFWGWAVFNIAVAGFDAGVVTFLCVMLSSACGFVHLAWRDATPRAVQRQAWLTGVSGGLVTINYAGALAIVHGKGLTLLAYFIFGALAWGLATVLGVWLLRAKLQRARVAHAEGVEAPLTVK
jgi:hypothetical protein